MRYYITQSLPLLMLLFWSTTTNAIQLSEIFKPDTTQNAVQKETADALKRGTPRGTVNGLLKAIAADDYKKASQYIDLSYADFSNNDSLLVDYVQKIEIVLSKNGTLLPISLINNQPDGNLNDGLALNLEAVGTFRIDGKKETLFLERQNYGTGQLWLVSQESVSKLFAYIDAHPELFTSNSSIKFLSDRWNGAPIADWLAILLLALVAYGLAWLTTYVIRWVVRMIWKNFQEIKYHRFLQSLLIPLRLVIAVSILLKLARVIELSIIVRQAFGVVNLIAIWTALFIFIWLLIEALSSYGEERLRERNSFGGLSAISFFRNSAKFSLIVIALLISFDTIGLNVTAGLAALGVGGIALALGAQKTVENIVGGLSVVFDQPVSVGDFCKFGNTLGTVEKIGMRSTRIRTLDRTIVTIPNADFSSQLIENYAKRDLFRLYANLGLRYETSSDQMRYILVELRKILYAHPKVNPDPARVRFLGYGSDSLKVELFAYVHAVDWNDFLGIQEDINLRIAKVIEDSGSGFAFPSQTLYLSKDQGLSAEKKAEAEAKVKAWMDEGSLNIPEFDAHTIDTLKNSLNYPKKSTEDK